LLTRIAVWGEEGMLVMLRFSSDTSTASPWQGESRASKLTGHEKQELQTA
jgi:hypothetical protein